MTSETFTEKYKKVEVIEFPNRVNKYPIVSISVVTFQHVDFIRQCLDCILMQETNYPYEILLGEDGSTDGTREICIEYAKKHPNKIRLFLHHRANNISIGGNPTGRFNFVNNLLSARGKYIALCEGDDYWVDAKKLQKQVDFLEKHEHYAACYHKTKVINERDEIIRDSKWVNYRDHSKDDLLYSKGEMITNTVMYKNQLNDMGGMMTVVNADTFLFHKIGELGGAKFISNIESSCYRVHEGGVWSLRSEIYKIKGSIGTYESIVRSLNRNNNYVHIDYIYKKVAKIVNRFMINELRKRRIRGYFLGVKLVLQNPMIKLHYFIMNHFSSIVRIFTNKIHF